MRARDLPFPPDRWNVNAPVCFDCEFVAIVDTGVYAMAQCQLMPEIRPFGLHWKCCRRFRKRRDDGIAPAPERRMNRG